MSQTAQLPVLISCLKMAQDFKLGLRMAGKRQAAFLEQGLECLMMVAIGKGAGGEEMEKLTAAEGVKPAVKGCEESIFVGVIGLKSLPASGKIDSCQKLRQMKGKAASLLNQNGCRLLPMHFSTSEPASEQGKAVGVVKADGLIRIVEKTCYGWPGAEGNSRRRAWRWINGSPL